MRLALTLTAALAAALIAAPRAGDGAMEPMRLPHVIAIPGVAADAGPLACGAELPDGCPLATATLVAHGDGRSALLTVEIADTPDARARGLMFRQSLPEFGGMLFAFPHVARGGFWMKDTPIPLDIAFLAGDGTVQEIARGVPYSLDILRPARAYAWVLEVNGGWFERHGFGPGDRIAVPQGLRGR